MKCQKIFDSFPPPEFLDFPYFGLSISDDFIRSLKFSRKGCDLVVEKYNEKKIPLGLVSAGYINDIEEVAQILGNFKTDLNMKYAKVSLPEEKAYLFTTEIPKVNSNEVRGAIEFKIEENVPRPASAGSFDYVLIDPNNDKNDHLNVVVSALPTKIVDMYMETMQKAGISILSLEIESQAIARALIPKGKRGTCLVVYFGFDKVGLYVVSNGVVHFTSTVSMKGESLDKPVFLSNEIKKLYAYWHTLRENAEDSEKTIIQIIVCGEKFDESIISFLSSHHKTPVIVGNVWSNAFSIDDTIPPITFNDSLRYAPAIGLALPSKILI